MKAEPFHKIDANRMAKRGRILFLVLATLIVINEAANITLALLGSSEHFRWLNSVLLRVLMIWVVWNLWQTGENLMRWGLAAWMLVKGFTNIWTLGYIIYSMAEITPPEDTNFFLQISATLFTIPAIQASLFIVIGLMLFFSPSIRAFLETRSEGSDETLSFTSK